MGAIVSKFWGHIVGDATLKPSRVKSTVSVAKSTQSLPGKLSVEVEALYPRPCFS